MRWNKTTFIETLEIVSSAMIIAAIIVGIRLYF